jgi:hypothetical protein
VAVASILNIFEYVLQAGVQLKYYSIARWQLQRTRLASLTAQVLH